MNRNPSIPLHIPPPLPRWALVAPASETQWASDSMYGPGKGLQQLPAASDTGARRSEIARPGVRPRRWPTRRPEDAGVRYIPGERPRAPRRRYWMWHFASSPPRAGRAAAWARSEGRRGEVRFGLRVERGTGTVCISQTGAEARGTRGEGARGPRGEGARLLRRRCKQGVGYISTDPIRCVPASCTARS